MKLYFKKILVLFFLIITFNINANYVYFLYKSDAYYIKMINNTPIHLDEPFNPIKEIDQSQTHRVLLTSLEKSRLTSLFYLGDKYEFNNVSIMLKNINYYQVTDKSSNTTIDFGLGEYDNIILYTAINFGRQEFNILDKLATVFTVKLLLKEITGKLERNEKIIKDEGLSNQKIEEEYNKFIAELKNINKDEIFNHIKRFVDNNFTLIMKKSSVKSDWISPSNLYFYKKGDYKSIAFFYYYTFKQVGFSTRSYLISELHRKSVKDLDNMKEIFFSNDALEKQKIEIKYKNVNEETVLKTFSNEYTKKKLKKPADIYFYYPPTLENSIFLITVKINDKWIYTTGINWIDAGIYKPERVCGHYSRSGCYYSYVNLDYQAKFNKPINEEEITWDVFFPSK